MYNMCEYCSGKEIKLNNLSYDCSDTIQIKNNIMTISGETPVGYENVYFEIDVEIKYCPMCGRKLK